MDGDGELIVKTVKLARDERSGGRARFVGALALWTGLVATQWIDPTPTFWLGALVFWVVVFAARYARRKDTWCFLDFCALGATIYATGGAESFLFWLPLVRVDARPKTPEYIALGYAACAPMTLMTAATLAGGVEVWSSGAFLLRLAIVASLAAFLLLQETRRSAQGIDLRRALDQSQRRVAELRDEARRLEHRAVRAEASARLRGSLPATMSQELRAPARAALEGGRALLASRLDPMQRRICEVIHGRAETLLARLDDITQLSSGELEPASVPVSWTQLLSEVGAMTRSRDPQSPDIRCIVDPEVPAYVLGDPVRLRQILLSLITAPAARSIEIRVGLAVPGLRLEVRTDTPVPHLSADAQPYGLELSVTKGWVAAMRGSLTLDQGPTARLDLPLRPCRPEAAVDARVA